MRGCLADVLAMYALRRLLGEDGLEMAIAKLDDREVVARAAQSIGWGRLRVGRLAAPSVARAAPGIGLPGIRAPGMPSSPTDRRATHVGGPSVGRSASAGAPEAQRAVNPAAPTPRVTVPDEATFGPDVDGATLAATLRAAAEDGVPFCEECERRRREQAPRAA